MASASTTASASACEHNANASTSASASRQNRFHSPTVELLPSSNAQNFFEEARITPTDEAELKRKFGKFCTRIPAGADGGEEEAYLSLYNFCKLLQYYKCTRASNYEAYFHAMDRNRDDKLHFEEFSLGCCAADPSTVHILNSFSGYERSRYIFAYYDTNRSNKLDFDHFARLTADCMSLTPASPHDLTVKTHAIEKARELECFHIDESNGQSVFTCIRFKQFHQFIMHERLRGTSRLFRFFKSIVKSRGDGHGRRAQGSVASATSTSAGGSAAAATSAGGAGGGSSASGGGERSAAEREAAESRPEASRSTESRASGLGLLRAVWAF